MIGSRLEARGRSSRGPIDRVLGVARQFVMSPDDIAQAVIYAVTMPETVCVNEIMVRPAQQLQIPGMSLPA